MSDNANIFNTDNIIPKKHSMTSRNKGFNRLTKAFGYSMNGLTQAWRNEESFRQETILCLCLLPITFLIGRNIIDYILLIGTLVLLLVTELFNSAIEALTDRVGLDQHELAGRAKDMASATVFIALVFLGFVWLSLTWLRMFSWKVPSITNYPSPNESNPRSK